MGPARLLFVLGRLLCMRRARPVPEARAVFFPPALMAWGLLLCGVVQLLRRRARLLLAYLPLYLVWFGLVLGAPSYMQIRYLLAFAYFIPCALFTLLAPAGAAKVGIDEKAASIV